MALYNLRAVHHRSCGEKEKGPPVGGPFFQSWNVSVQVDEPDRYGGVRLKGRVVGVEVAAPVGEAGLDGVDRDVDHEVAGGVAVGARSQSRS